MSRMNHEIDPLSWDNPILANFCQDISDDYGERKTTHIQEMGEDKGKTQDEKSSRIKGLGKKGGETFDRGIHIWTERERRKKMKDMFTNLQSFRPKLPPKVDKTTIVEETISYIKSLESTIQGLEKQKQERLQGGPSRLANHPTRETFMANKASTAAIKTCGSPNVVLSICGNDAHFAVYAPKKPGLFTTLCCVLEKHRLEVVSSNISSQVDRGSYMIQARVAKGVFDDQFPELMNVAEIYSQVVEEMIFWVTS